MVSTEPPSQATYQSSFEQGVALALHLWPALTLAVQSNWGGSDSEDKRAWFAGAIVDLFPDLGSKPAAAPNPTSKPTITIATQQQQPKSTATAGTTPGDGDDDDSEPDALDVETVLLQVMLDEFDVNVDDDSAYEVAEQIVRVRAECARGKFDGELAGLQRRFDARGGAKVVGVFKKGEDEDAETDWDTDDEDEEDEGDSDDGDVPMGDAPPKREKEEPEVDDEGFTKVSRRKR